jgi:hypothetical protein
VKWGAHTPDTAVHMPPPALTYRRAPEKPPIRRQIELATCEAVGAADPDETDSPSVDKGTLLMVMPLLEMLLGYP